MFEAHGLNDESEWMKVRHIAYEVWRKGAKHPPEIQTYMPIGVEKSKEMTTEQLDEIWRQYGKLKN